MKRARTVINNNNNNNNDDDDDDGVLTYPKILFIVNGDNHVKGPAQAYIFQPYFGEECSRIITKLRAQEGTQELAKTWESFISVTIDYCVKGVTRHHHSTLNRICLIDTKKNKIGMAQKIHPRQICRQGACQVEYLYLTSDEIGDFLKKLGIDEVAETPYPDMK